MPTWTRQCSYKSVTPGTQWNKTIIRFFQHLRKHTDRVSKLKPTSQWEITDAQNQKMWLTAALWSDTWGVMCHFQTNSRFSYRLGGQARLRSRPPYNTGVVGNTQQRLCSGSSCSSEHALGWDCCFHLVCCSWGSFFFFFFHPLLSSYSSLDFIAHTLGDDFVNETMHILAAFMMVMTSSGGTMEGERWHSGVMVVGNGGGARECLFVCRWWVKKLISPCQLRNNQCFFFILTSSDCSHKSQKQVS